MPGPAGKNTKATLVLLALLCAGPLPAVTNAQTESRRSLTATLVEVAPKLDGEVRDDPAWQTITPAEGFTQTTPDEGAWISFHMMAVFGGFYRGDRVSLQPGLRLRLGERFTAQLNWIQNDVNLPEGDFVTKVGRFRLSYSFTPKIALEALLQYNNVDDYFSSNLRFSWLRKANTGLYIVYNDIQGFDSFTGEEPNRSLIVKYTHMFDLF